MLFEGFKKSNAGLTKAVIPFMNKELTFLRFLHLYKLSNIEKVNPINFSSVGSNPTVNRKQR